MQSLAKETIIFPQPLECSAQLLETIPIIMRRIHCEMRSRTLGGLTVPQFRTLSYIYRHPDSSLSDLAVHLGLTSPSTSKLVQKLVVKKAVDRRVANDRRRICLSLTEQGATALNQARLETQQQLAKSLGKLKSPELLTVLNSLKLLQTAFKEGGIDVNLP
jgi:DNA-binding MarR family transcriptional regulator